MNLPGLKGTIMHRKERILNYLYQILESSFRRNNEW
jgi:hypothetical protein